VFVAAIVAVLVACAGVARAAPGDTFLESAKLTAPTTGPEAEIGGGELGGAAAVSADGTTALVGAFDDASGNGAAYVYMRSGTAWTLQAKLTAPTSGANAEIGSDIEFGSAVALSADGNTALIGGFGDNTNAGGVWVFTRGPSGWAVQTKLIAPTGGADHTLGTNIEFGNRISLNPAGTTALIAGVGDHAFAGAAWLFARTSPSATTWTEQHKFTAPTTGNDREIGGGEFGSAAVLSPDGQTAIIGGDADNGSVGAAWVFGGSGTTWTEQAKLVPPTTGADAGVGTPTFGIAASLSDDASTVLIGGQSDDQRGAAWVFTRTTATATAWSERAKLVAPTSGANAEIGQGFFGAAVALSADAGTAVVGASFDNSAIGAAYAFDGSGGTWTLHSKLTAPAGRDAEFGSGVFGTDIALSHDATTLLVTGLSDNNLAGAAWSYAATTPPAVSGVAPAVGATRGGTAVAIHGSGFATTGIDAVSSVTFAGVPAASFRVVSATEIDAVAPPHGAGVADVIVSAPAGTTPIGPSDQFHYVASPGAPTKVRTRAGNRRVTVTFRPRPAGSRAAGAGGAVTYRVIASPGGAHATGKRSPITVHGLRNGKRYRFHVVATNVAGTGPSSRLSAAATPFAPPRIARASLRGAGRSAPRLALTVSAGKHSPRLTSVAVSLTRGLGFNARRLAGHVLVSGHRPRGTVQLRRGVLTIRLRRSVARMAVRIAAPAITATASLARSAKHRRAGRQTVTLTIVDAAGNQSSVRLRLRAS
jgi:hypothetical protein